MALMAAWVPAAGAARARDAYPSFVAPPGVPPPLVARINHDVVEILTRRGVSDKLRALRLEPAATTPEETASFFAGETTLWGKVIKDANIRGQ